MSLKNKKNCPKVFSTLGFMLLFQFSFAQLDFSGVDKFLDKSKDVLKKDFSIIISKDGKNIFTKKSGEEFNNATHVPIANASKWLTCAMIMTLVDEGKISLDDNVSKYLPIYAKYLKSYITIRHCLTHQTGLEQHQYKPYGNKNFADLETEVNNYASKYEIVDNPGEKFSYGSVGINIAARICEVVTKKQFVTLMNDKIFKPLQLRNTNYGDGDKSPNPSGGAFSSVQDYTTFLTMLLNKGKHKGKTVMTENAIKMMHSLQLDEEKVKNLPEEANGTGQKMGFGVWLIEANSKGEATVVASPGFFCNWAYIDVCRGYSCVLLVKDLVFEKRKNYMAQLKELIDEIIPSTCN